MSNKCVTVEDGIKCNYYGKYTIKGKRYCWDCAYHILSSKYEYVKCIKCWDLKILTDKLYFKEGAFYCHDHLLESCEND